MRKKDKILLLSGIAAIFLFVFVAYISFNIFFSSGDRIAKKTNLLITDELDLLYSKEIGEWRGGSVISIYEYKKEKAGFFDQFGNNNSEEEPFKNEKNNSFEEKFVNKLEAFKIPKKYKIDLSKENYYWYDNNSNSISIVHIPQLKRIIVQYVY